MEAKENRNVQNEWKFTSRQGQEMESFESSNDSKRYGPTDPKSYTRTTNKDIFGGEKFIQSQVYSNSKETIKMDRSQGGGSEKGGLLKNAFKNKK